MATFVFPDTNVWLHFRPFGDFDWRALVGDDLVIVATPPLIRELDGRKNVPRTRDRARRALHLIERWEIEGPSQLRAGVTGMYWHAARVTTPSAYGLDPMHSDDVMLAYVKAFCEEHEGESVVYLSDDLEPRLTAKRVGLRAATPPEDARLPVEETEDQAEIRRLRTELAALENRQPKLTVRIRNGADNGRRYEDPEFGAPVPTKESFVSNALRSAHLSAPEIVPPTSAPVRQKSDEGTLRGISLSELESMQTAFQHGFGAIASTEYARYARDREAYFKAIQAAAETNWAILEQRSRSVVLTLDLFNDGTAPADDTDVWMHVPDGPDVLRSTGSESVEPPKPPRKPRSTAEIIGDGMRMRTLVPPFFPSSTPSPPPNVTRSNVRKTNSYEIRATVRQIKQHTSVRIDTLALVFASTDSARSLTIEYEINSASLPKKLVGNLNVIIRAGA